MVPLAGNFRAECSSDYKLGTINVGVCQKVAGNNLVVLKGPQKAVWLRERNILGLFDVI